MEICTPLSLPSLRKDLEIKIRIMIIDEFINKKGRVFYLFSVRMCQLKFLFF